MTTEAPILLSIRTMPDQAEWKPGQSIVIAQQLVRNGRYCNLPQ